MQLVVTTYSDETGKYDCRRGLQIELVAGGKATELEFIEGEPEDATLGRDFSDVYRIAEIVQLAYEAGVNGEPLFPQFIEGDCKELFGW